MLLVICACLLLFPASAYAKIVADQEFNDSVVFYFWDTWSSSDLGLGLGSGGFYTTFLKHIASDGTEKYWIRIDSSRRDSVLSSGNITIGNNIFPIEIIENPSSLHQRAGIGNRSTPNGKNVNIHIFYPLSPEILSSIAVHNGPVFLSINFQTRKDIRLMFRERNMLDIKKMLMLKKTNYAEFAR